MIVAAVQLLLALLQLAVIGLTLVCVRQMAAKLLISVGLCLSLIADFGASSWFDFLPEYLDKVFGNPMMVYLFLNLQHVLLLLMDVLGWAVIIFGLLFLGRPQPD